MPNALLEAMACGRPVLASAVSFAIAAPGATSSATVASRSGAGSTFIDVITSYSIHYTKLYESMTRNIFVFLLQEKNWQIL